MAFEPAISSKLDVSMNVNALRLVDPSLNLLQDHATHVVLYSFKPDSNEWEKVNIEGALFIYSRKTEPRYNMTIINRLNTNNLVEFLNGDMNLQVQEPFLLYRNGEGKIFGIWFYSQKECAQISKTLDKIIKELSANGTKNGVDNMMSMLSMSEGSKKVHNNVKVPDGTSKRVLDFFAMAKITTPCQPPGRNQRPPATSPQLLEPKPQANVKPLLQKLLANPNRPVKTVEQIEKQHMSTPPKRESAPIDIIKVSPVETSQNRPRPLVLSNSALSVEKKLENGFGFVRIPESSPRSDTPSGIEPLDRPGSSDVETPNKVPLLTPNMFMSSCNDREPRDPSASFPDSSLDVKPEPLTKSQLLQAVSYLLKNDPDFVNKLHEAYVKSFVDRVS